MSSAWKLSADGIKKKLNCSPVTQKQFKQGAGKQRSNFN